MPGITAKDLTTISYRLYEEFIKNPKLIKEIEKENNEMKRKLGNKPKDKSEGEWLREVNKDFSTSLSDLVDKEIVAWLKTFENEQ